MSESFRRHFSELMIHQFEFGLRPLGKGRAHLADQGVSLSLYSSSNKGSSDAVQIGCCRPRGRTQARPRRLTPPVLVGRFRPPGLSRQELGIDLGAENIGVENDHAGVFRERNGIAAKPRLEGPEPAPWKGIAGAAPVEEGSERIRTFPLRQHARDLVIRRISLDSEERGRPAVPKDIKGAGKPVGTLP
ncbi:MAG TPA: hypothetical protein VG457_01560, partial [Planctomycetota bacterium]|nr:hypothetical protein [Planctomycetota bacterium]